VFELQTKPLLRQKRPRKDNDDEQGAEQVTSMLENSSLLGTLPLVLNDRSSTTTTQQSQTISNPVRADQTDSIKVIFRKVEPSLHKRKAHPDEHVKLVDATVDRCHDENSQSEKTHEQNELDFVGESRFRKRPKFSLRMVETRVVNERQFWESQEFQSKKIANMMQSSQVINKTIAANGHSISQRSSALRDRMKRRARVTPKASSRTKGFRILDPLSKLVDDSLRSIHQGSKTHNPIHSILQHLELLQEQSQSGGLVNLVNWQCTDGSGTMLHICALVNSMEGAQAVCRWYPNLIDFWKKDGDGRTAMDVARETEAKGVLDVIRDHLHGEDLSIGHERETEKRQHAEKGDDDFVYDVYYLDFPHLHEKYANQSGATSKEAQPSRPKEEPQSRIQQNQDISTETENNVSVNAASINISQGSSKSDSQDSKATTHLSSTDNPNESEHVVVNMYGGVGYWVDGELVLDVVHHEGESDDSQMEDDEYDSNREDCDANDYPDEDDSDLCCNSIIDRGTGMTPPRFMNGQIKSSVAESDDDSDFDDGIDFRNRPIDFNSVKIGGARHQFGGYNNMQDDDDFDSDDEYRGFMCRNSNSWNNERIYCETEAYDPDMDGEDS
jgi:hypothetical protein